MTMEIQQLMWQLEELAAAFRQAAFVGGDVDAALAGQDRVARPLVDAGAGPDELAAMNLGAVPPSGDLDRMRQRREALGLPHGDDAPLLIDADGNRIPSAQVPLHLRRARLQRVVIETNGDYCKGLLAVRYPAAAR